MGADRRGVVNLSGNLYMKRGGIFGLGASWELHHFVLEHSVLRCLSEEIEPISATGQASVEEQGGAPIGWTFDGDASLFSR